MNSMTDSNAKNSPDSLAQSLEKKIRDKDNRENALLHQKIELLNLELKDSREREENIKRLHDTMISAFRDGPLDGTGHNDSDVKKLIDQYQQEYRTKFVKERKEETEFILKNESGIESDKNKCCEKNREVIQDLTEALEALKEENEELKKYLDEYRPCSCQDNNNENAEIYKKQLQDLQNKYNELEGFLKNEQASGQEKAGRNKMFTFGDPSADQTAEFKSETSVRDEIDRLNFLVEEKEYMNEELRNEVCGEGSR